MNLKPPIRLRQLAEAFVIEDGDGTVVAYIYFEDDQNRRSQMKRLTKADAEEAAKIMAAALRASIG
jgi:K+/H+ antiporter YhaU regulatory subunit KhtT